MLYIVLKYLAQLCFFIYHRKVYKLEAENLPKDGPVLLTCNHPGAFLDACLISAWSDRPLYYLTRGDMFKKGIANWFLTATHQIPIYRADHGIGQMRQNRDTFSTCYEYLNQDKVILIFPEAKADIEKRLRPLYKGAARIVFGTQDEFGKLPAIIPVGFTFFEPRYFGYDAIFHYGKPVDASAYLELYKTDPQAALNALTEDIRLGLKATMIYLDTDEGESVFNDLIPLIEVPPASFPRVTRSLKAFNWQDGVARKVNAMSEDEITAMRGELDQLKSIGRSAGIAWDSIPRLMDSRPGILGIALMAPIRLLGVIIGWLPRELSYKLFINKVKRDAFIGPIKAMLGFFLYAIYFMILGITLGIFMGWTGWAIAFGLALVLYFAMRQKRKPSLAEWIRFRKLDSSQLEQLTSKRDEYRKRFGSSLA